MRTALLPWSSGAALLLAAAFYSTRLAPVLPPLETIQLSAADAMQDIGFLALGMRRLAADIHFIELLVYYGAGEAESDEAAMQHKGSPEMYPDLYPQARRILELDPHFRYAGLYFAGALAFNLNRTQEAVDLMTYALQRDPQAWQYRLYLAAIAYRRNGQFGKLVDVLAPALNDPDCPSMLKSIVAGVYLKLGQTGKAIALYEDLAEHSKDPGFRQIARQRLEDILRGLQRR